MVTDLSVDQIKQSDSFEIKLPKRRLDPTLIVGLSAAVCLIVTALVLTGSLSAFYNIPAILLVFLGTFAVTMISFKLNELARSLSECIELLAPRSAKNSHACDNILHLARYSKENGILALEKINNSIDESAYLLGYSKIKTFSSIHVPYLKNNIILIVVLISLEIIKELPITMILRPFNFETFATQAYVYASQDLLEAAALPSLFLISWATILIIFSSKYILSQKN